MSLDRYRLTVVVYLFIVLVSWFVPTLKTDAAEDYPSLFAAIQAANSSGGSHTITLSEDIALSAALPPITGEINIEGGGHSISGVGIYRIFDVAGGTLVINDLTMTRGSAEIGGAIRLRNGAQVTIENSALSDNAATHGGAIATSSSSDRLTINSSSFSGNIAEKSAGAIYANGGTLHISNSEFVRNCGERATNGVTTEIRPDNFELTFDSHGCVHITEFWIDRALEGDGGAIRLLNGAQVTVEGSIFSENRATHGGAISTSGDSDRLTIESSSFAGNQAESSAGVINVMGGTVSISKSSFMDNRSASSGGVIGAESGGIQIANSTFHNNRAFGPGGVLDVSGSEVTLTHVTMLKNVSTNAVSNAVDKQDGIVNLRNSIIAGGGRGDDCRGGLDQTIGNLSQDGTCGISASEDPRLDGLTGSPPYHPLRDHSPAIDAADPEYCLDTDQIGTARPQDDGCDIGAIESTTAMLAPTPIVPPPPCPLSLQIIAANTDAPAGGCPAGSGHDFITLTQDITLSALLPRITSDITIEGNGYTISGAGRFRIFSVDAGKLTINNLTLTKGKTFGQNDPGGAIRIQAAGEVVVSDSIFSDNQASTGGAIGTESDQTKLTVYNSVFVGNLAYDGGAININGGGSATVTNSSFLKNTVPFQGGVGGAINAGFSGTVDISNSTFAGNTANRGGAVYARWNARVTLTHVTMFGNHAGLGEGVLTEKDFIGVFRLRNSIVAGGGRNDCDGRLTQNVGSLIEDGSCSPAVSGDPLLEEATGSAAHLTLQPGSPAIDAADARYCRDTDQIGAKRVGLCDIGAIESIPVSTPVSDCTLTTTHTLNFREEPGGTRFGSVPENSTVAATARTPGWFNVEHRGTSGWISADYVRAQGSCG